MKAFIFGFEKREKQWVETVLESPAFGSKSGNPIETPYRWVLLPKGFSPAYESNKPIIQCEQQFRDGSWGSCGGGWEVEMLLNGNSWSPPFTWDTIALDGGQQWYASGLQDALNEARGILGI